MLAFKKKTINRGERKSFKLEIKYKIKEKLGLYWIFIVAVSQRTLIFLWQIMRNH